MVKYSIRGGDKMKRYFEALDQKLSDAKEVQVGFLEGSTYPDGTSVPLAAAVQEFGAPSRNIPPRPYFRKMIKRKSPEWPDAFAKQLKATNYDTRAAFERIGAGIASQLQNSIDTYNDGPPLKPATIKRKGFDKQLIDTAFMKNSVAFKVE